MSYAQGSCDALREDGQKLECAHSGDFRRQPRTVEGRWGEEEEEQGKIDRENKTTMKEELSLESESYAAMASFVLEFAGIFLTPYFHCNCSEYL